MARGQICTVDFEAGMKKQLDGLTIMEYCFEFESVEEMTLELGLNNR